MTPLLQNTLLPTLHIRVNNHVEVLSMTELVRLQSDRNYTLLILTGGRRIMVAKTLGRFEKSLLGNFVRIHKSHIVNMAYVSHLSKVTYCCILKDNEPIKVSQKRFGYFKDVLQSYR